MWINAKNMPDLSKWIKKTPLFYFSREEISSIVVSKLGIRLYLVWKLLKRRYDWVQRSERTPSLYSVVYRICSHALCDIMSLTKSTWYQMKRLRSYCVEYVVLNVLEKTSAYFNSSSRQYTIQNSHRNRTFLESNKWRSLAFVVFTSESRKKQNWIDWASYNAYKQIFLFHRILFTS